MSQEKSSNYWANQIAQLICPRLLKQKGFASLPEKFWADKRFAREYKLQLIKSRSLLKMYSPQAIINALKSKEGLRIWSLTAPWLDGIIAAEEKRLQILAEKINMGTPHTPSSNAEKLPDDDGPRPAFNPKKSVFDKLD